MTKTNTNENSPVTRPPHVLNARAYCEFIADSIKVALSIGNCALGSYCLLITQTNHYIVPYAQLPMTN